MPAAAKVTGADPIRTAQRHLARRDPVLRRLVAAVGPCTFRPEADCFLVLVRSIISQLISTQAAASVFARLREAVGEGGVTPAGILAAGTEALRSAGLSAAKARALEDLATRARTGELPLDRLPALTDEEVIARLLPVRGVGTWTAQMFLIFGLGRLDVLPVDDFGLRAGVRDNYNLGQLPSRAELTQVSLCWKPYRTVATWYFWRSRGFVPQSEADSVGRNRRPG
jgi:DNA-3-methyladenine glycosylase II